MEGTSVLDRARVTAASKMFLVREGKLHITGKLGWREVPAIAERYNIIFEYHNLSHAHPDRLY